MRENPFGFFSSHIGTHICRFFNISALNYNMHYYSSELVPEIHWTCCAVYTEQKKKWYHDVGILSQAHLLQHRQVHRWAASQWQSFDFVACWNDSVYMSLDLALQSAKLFPLNFDSNYSQVPSCHYTIYVPMGKRIKKKLTTLKKKYRQTIFRLSNLITGGQTTYSIIQMRLCVSVSAGCVNENWTFNANSWLCCAMLYCTVLFWVAFLSFFMYPSMRE